MKLKIKYISFLILGLTIVFLTKACRFNEQFYNDENAQLEFSRDTVRFDTVFTTVGSATRSFKIKNPYNQTVNITNIRLQNQQNSFFRLNINGTDSDEVDDVRIPPLDSIYIFAEVTIDPDQPLSISPFVIEDKVLIETNGNQQMVWLEAWGQNANYIPSNTGDGGFALLSCDFNEVIWDDPKPYVIYGILLIDSCSLKLPPGCEVYVHGGIVTDPEIGSYNDGRIIVLKDGNIKAEGTFEDPIFIQGDRLEPEYSEVAAQWTGIQILPESRGNLFDHTIIRDGILGISVDSASSLEIKHSQVYNHASRALVSFHPESLKIENSLFYGTPSETVLLKYGGNVSIDYSTIVGFENQQAGLYVDNFRCTDPIFCAPILINPMKLSMRNTIIAGNGTDELALVDGTGKMEPGVLNFSMENCLIKLDTLLNSRNYPNFFDQCINCFSIDRNEALFFDSDENDFHLDTLSQAEARAIPISGIFDDLEGNIRDMLLPDIGCYEYQY